jgi:hypothetical protein
MAGIMLLLLLTLPLATQALQKGSCDYAKDDYRGETFCINPKENASSSFTWEPLFPDGATFVYAIDEIDAEEYDRIHPNNDFRDVPNGTALVGWWLEYDEISLNNTDLNMETQLTVFYANVSTSIGGAANGCENLLGSDCVSQLNSTLFTIYSESASYKSVVDELYSRYDEYPDLVKACPKGMFQDYMELDKRPDTVTDNGDQSRNSKSSP